MMSKPVTIVLLGADRVGKSTIVTNTLNALQESRIDAYTLHFSGPKPSHSNPIQQYIEPFDKVLQYGPRVVICDRFGAEVCFYDKFRRHTDISVEWAQAAESYFLEKSEKVLVFMVKRSWEWSKPYHVEEIRSENPECTAWWIKTQLQMRKAEHEAYYEYMSDYLKNHSLLPHGVLERTPRTFDLAYCVSDV